MARATAEARGCGRAWTIMLENGSLLRLRAGGYFAGHDSKEALKKELSRQHWEQSPGDKLLQQDFELDAANKHIRTLEDDLASQQRTVQILQEFLFEKEEGVRVLNEKLDALISAKTVELEAYGIRHMESEKLELVHLVQEHKFRLDQARLEEEGRREAGCKARQEHLKQLQLEKAAKILYELKRIAS